MITAGLTGSIATGKSTVSATLSDLGAKIIDADKIAHSVCRKGLPAWQSIVDQFGDVILMPDGEIDRTELGRIVFHQPEALARLNAIVHPQVRTEIARRLKSISRTCGNVLAVLDVPLLFETGLDKGLTEIIVVYAPAHIQLQRLMNRDGLDRAVALARIGTQMSIEAKKQLATIVIDNSGTLSETRRNTRAVYKKIKLKYGIR